MAKRARSAGTGKVAKASKAKSNRNAGTEPTPPPQNSFGFTYSPRRSVAKRAVWFYLDVGLVFAGIRILSLSTFVAVGDFSKWDMTIFAQTKWIAVAAIHAAEMILIWPVLFFVLFRDGLSAAFRGLFYLWYP